MPLVEMTTEQLVELVLLAREDALLWDALKENEERLEAEARVDDAYAPDALRDAPNLPLMVAELVDSQYESGEDFDYTELILLMRCA